MSPRIHANLFNIREDTCTCMQAQVLVRISGLNFDLDQAIYYIIAAVRIHEFQHRPVSFSVLTDLSDNLFFFTDSLAACAWDSRQPPVLCLGRCEESSLARCLDPGELLFGPRHG